MPESLIARKEKSFSLTRVEDGVRVTLSCPRDREQLSALIPARDIAEAKELAAKEAAGQPANEEQATPELATAEREARPVNPWALDLLGCHLANAHGDVPYTWTPQRVGNAVPLDFEAVHSEPAVKGQRFELQERDRIAQMLVKDHGSVLIDGRTGSGKSAQTALWAYRCARDGAGRIDLDLIDANDGAESVMSALLTLPKYAWYLVVMEHIPASLDKARAVYRLIDRLREKHGMDIAVLANGWLDLRNSGNPRAKLGLPRNTLIVRTQPEAVFESMVLEHSLRDRHLISALRDRSGRGEDLVLAQLAFDYYREHGTAPSREEFTRHVAEKYGLTGMVELEEQKALYRFACLGAHEIEVPAVEITYGMAPYIASFEQRELIERADTTYRVGSRSVAREMARYAFQNWCDANGDGLQTPAMVAATTLMHAGPDQLRSALGRLDFISAARGEAPPTGRMLANAWSKWEQLRKLTARAVDADNEWGGNAAAAAFACVAMSHLDLEEHWERTAEWIRGRWSYAPGQLPMWVGDKTMEKVDFQGVTASMSREDESPDSGPWPPEMRGDRIDVDEMHRTWMLGVLLSFEGTAPRLDMDRLECLYESACEAQRPNGSFYPERVPWVTARVLIGLCLAGYRDHKVARDAALWLMRESYDFGWKSGTGSWNTDAMTRAMCVIALLRQGVRPEEHQIGLSLGQLDVAHLTSSEIDLSLKIEAMLLGRREDRSQAYADLATLLDWAIDEQQWRGHSEQRLLNQEERPEGEGESSKVPFVVSQLLACIQQMVVNELDKYFAEDFDRRPAPESSASSQDRPQQSPSSDPGPDAELRALALAQLEEIGTQIKSDIESRQKALRTRIQPQHRKFFQERVVNLRELQRVLGACAAEVEQGPVTDELIARIDRLGLEAVGLSYEPIQGTEEDPAG